MIDLAEANEQFYRAFEALDVRLMDEVWVHAEYVKCVHPGWPLITGWDAVRDSWASIFENTAEMRFTIGDVETRVLGGVGWVTCTENILQSLRGRISVTSVLATNLFERTPDGWRMILHHASHVLNASPDA